MNKKNEQKKISQEEVRRAMKDAQKKLGIVKKINSPIAKYNPNGQIICIICKSIVRSEAAWPAHINSKSHKENIAKVAKTKEIENTPQPSVVTFKRPAPYQESTHQPKRIKGILKNSTAPQNPSNLPSDFFDKPSSSKIVAQANGQAFSNGSTMSKEPVNNKAKTPQVDSKNINGVESMDTGSSSTLPEGFFDDPVLDAKARNVEYKNPLDEEWENFQKEIREETAQSAEIIADDQEEATSERIIDNIDEQLHNWSRVMDLVSQKKHLNREKIAEEDDSSGDEIDFDESLDWRAKQF